MKGGKEEWKKKSRVEGQEILQNRSTYLAQEKAGKKKRGGGETGHEKGRERKKAHKGWVVNPREPQSLVRREQLKGRLPEVKVEAVVRRVSRIWKVTRISAELGPLSALGGCDAENLEGQVILLNFFFFSFFGMSFCKIRLQWCLHRIVLHSYDPTLQHVFVWRNGLLQFIFVAV